MRNDVLDQMQRLRTERRPFALATVVAAGPPTSGTPGARALVLPDGQVEGWIGGHCAQPTVVRQALEALADGVPRLIILSPDDDPHTSSPPGVVRLPMRCAGQGELHIFVEPFLPAIELVIAGSSPVAQALAGLGALLGFEVWACDPDADRARFAEADRLVPSLDALKPLLTTRSYVIVATIGIYDEEAAHLALESPASYVGLVASQKRFAEVERYLRERGVAETRLAQLKRPIGTKSRAVLPAEIAFSVMAELLDIRRQRVGLTPLAPDAGSPALSAPRAEATDPICGMTVDIATARHTSERDGQRYYFCCAGCQRQFEAAVAEQAGG
ncbi:MAG TPA: XdhC family protein [Ktedonobacterales bacterium]|nr:XdhC family protein [Ktedonobacterales bacterium]